MNYLLAQRQKPLRVCWINYDNRTIDDSLEIIEGELDRIQTFEMVEISSIDAENFHPCDLLILIAYHMESAILTRWIQKIAERMKSHIWTPAIIIGELSRLDSQCLVKFSTTSNWYFDVIDTEHLSSLALRAANLIRIHDHLHEIHNYKTMLDHLEQNIEKLRTDISKIQNNSNISHPSSIS